MSATPVTQNRRCRLHVEQLEMHESSYQNNLKKIQHANEKLIGKFVTAKQAMDLCTNVFTQKWLAEYMKTGKLYLQYEGMNPSGSFKDNGMSAAFTHARSIGATRGPCIGHIAPEAAAGGPLAAWARRSRLLVRQRTRRA